MRWRPQSFESVACFLAPQTDLSSLFTTRQQPIPDKEQVRTDPPSAALTQSRQLLRHECWQPCGEGWGGAGGRGAERVEMLSVQPLAPFNMNSGTNLHTSRATVRLTVLQGSGQKNQRLS